MNLVSYFKYKKLVPQGRTLGKKQIYLFGPYFSNFVGTGRTSVTFFHVKKS